MSKSDKRLLSDSLILALDVETTGINPLKDSIVELGGVYVKGGHLCGPPFCSRVNPKRFISVDATKVHGISAEDVAQSPTWKVVGSWLKDHLDQAQPIICGYNILSFDAPMINAENQRAGLTWQLPMDQILDPYIFCRWYHPEISSTLGSMCKTYGLDLPEDEAHSADADSEVTALLVVAMTWAGYIPDDFEQALAQQHTFKQKMQEDRERWGKRVYVNRQDPQRLHIADGIYRGRCFDDLDEGYIKRILKEWKNEYLSEEGKKYVEERRKTQETLF